VITIVTNHGDIIVELFEESAPVSSENFRQYAKDGFFADTVFHRVIPNFMIQGGGMAEDLSRKDTREAIKNEADNGEKQQEAVAEILLSEGWSDIKATNDLAGIPRVTAAIWQ
jgi:cyclophilin family peptidyl-prolyl cis-trans isomerase